MLEMRGEDGTTNEALRKLMDDEVWSAHFAACCREGVEGLIAEAGRYADALRALGNDSTRLEVEQALLEAGGYAASDVFPHAQPYAVEDVSPVERPVGCSANPHAAGWDVEWESDITHRALRYIVRHVGDVGQEAMDTTAVDTASDAMNAAAEVGDREAYLRAARRWVSAWRRAAEYVRAERDSSPHEAMGKKKG